MPPNPPQSALVSWETLFTRSLATRLSPETFETYISFLADRSPLPSPRIADLFLSPTSYNEISLDLRVPRYLLVLLGKGLVDIPVILRTLWGVSSFHALQDDGNPAEGENQDGDSKLEGKDKGKERKRWTNSYASEETIFYALTKLISSGTTPKNARECAGIIEGAIIWMEGVIAAGHSQHSLLSLNDTQTSSIHSTHMALGTLVMAIVECPLVQNSISKGRVKKDTRQALRKALEGFVPLLVQSSPQSANRLEVFRTETLAVIEPVEKIKGVESAASKEIEDILEESMGIGGGVEGMVVADMPVVNSRAGLYVYLNSLVSSSPQTFGSKKC